MAAAPLMLDPLAEARLRAMRERASAPLTRAELGTYAVPILAIVGASVVLGALTPLPGRGDIWRSLALVAAFAVASRLEVELEMVLAVPTQLVLVPMLFLLPPAEVPLAVAAGTVAGQLVSVGWRRVPARKVLVPAASALYAVGPAAVFAAAGRPGPGAFGAGILAAALVAQSALDFVNTAACEWTLRRVSPREVLRPAAWTLAVDALLAPIGFAGAMAAQTTWSAALLPMPVLALIVLLARERQGRLDQTLELSSAYRGTAFLLGDVIEADDAYTGSHSRHVVELVLAVADRLALDGRQMRLAEFTALLHDVGKIKMPAELIEKPGPLTPEERAVIETHTVEGEALLRQVGGMLADVGGLVRSCHERWDGAGYPDGLAGEAIPLVARIVSCCDAFDAMTTDRPYRPALTFDAALEELRTCSGSQFDPVIAAILLEIVAASRPEG